MTDTKLEPSEHETLPVDWDDQLAADIREAVVDALERRDRVDDADAVEVTGVQGELVIAEPDRMVDVHYIDFSDD